MPDSRASFKLALFLLESAKLRESWLSLEGLAGIIECRLEKAFFGPPVRRAGPHIKARKQYNNLP